MSIAAITGPRTGATGFQLITAMRLLVFHGVAEMHNGDAIGVDNQLYYLGRGAGCVIHLHPPTNYKYRAFNGDHRDVFYPEKAFKVRDRDMVDASHFLIGFPYSHELSGGTGYTIGYTQEQEKPVILVFANGSFVYERWPDEIKLATTVL